MSTKLLLLLLLFSCYQSNAQKKLFDPATCPAYFSKPGKFSIDNPKLPFSTVMVVDKRFDTSKLGYARTNDFEISIIKTKKSFAETISNSISHSTEGKRIGDTTKKLLIVIRHLWLDGQADNEKFRSMCTASLDVYLEKDAQYSALFKIDTFFASANALLKTDEELLISPFKFCLEKLDSISVDHILATRRKITAGEIAAFYTQRFNNAKPKDDSTSTGVFLTFRDFLQNRPTYTEFRVRKKALADDIYIVENGKETILSKFWGYCDGKNTYIKLGYNFFPLHRQNNTYDVYGANHVEHRGVPSAGARGINFIIQQNQSDQLIMKAMQLNMETGRPY